MTETKTSQQAGADLLGPLDIFVLEFSGNQFRGEILRNLHDLVAAGTIRILDLVVITKNESGRVSALEVQELGSEANEALAPLNASISQMITDEDIETIGQLLSNNATAGVLVIENSWAAKTKQAMLDANGRVVMFERIPHQFVQDALDDLAALGAPVV